MKVMNIAHAPVVAKAKEHNKVAQAPKAPKAPVVTAKAANKLNVKA